MSKIVCHYCRQPAADPTWIMGEPMCESCKQVDDE